MARVGVPSSYHILVFQRLSANLLVPNVLSGCFTLRFISFCSGTGTRTSNKYARSWNVNRSKGSYRGGPKVFLNALDQLPYVTGTEGFIQTVEKGPTTMAIGLLCSSVNCHLGDKRASFQNLGSFEFSLLGVLTMALYQDRRVSLAGRTWALPELIQARGDRLNWRMDRLDKWVLSTENPTWSHL